MTDTRARLLAAARHLFSERGFADVTVREICSEAEANVALVNYYFGDKFGLYVEIVDSAIAPIREMNALVIAAPERATAEEKLEHFIRVFLERVGSRDETHSWIHKIMQHEMTRPTDAAARIAEHAIAPRLRYLAEIVTELLDCSPDDVRVMECAGSIHGLCLGYARMVHIPKVFLDSISKYPLGDIDPDEMASHIVRFSLGGIRASRAVTGAPRLRPAKA